MAMYVLRAGLSQGESFDIAANLDRLKALIQSGLAKAEAAGRSDLVEKGKAYWRDYLGTRFITVPAGLLDKARQEIVALFNSVVPWSNQVAVLSVGGAAEVERLQRGSTFTEQVRQTLAPVTETLSELSGLGVSGWLLAAGAGLLLFLLLRR